jgi:hypothetical protein
MKKPHPHICLPPLTSQEALAVINILDALIAAVWRTHGVGIEDLQTRLNLESVPDCNTECALDPNTDLIDF